MNFHEKLSLLMDITQTTNQELALYSCLDSSYISRLKNGKRMPVKAASYMQAFAHFFAKRIKVQNQEELFKKLLELDSTPPFPQKFLSDFICQWLMDDFFTLKEFPQTASATSAASALPAEGFSTNREAKLHSSCSVYFKTEGKRQAALNFLGKIAESSQPQTLLFFSDEDISWMADDAAFTAQWAEFMKKILNKGNRIRIIHDINRGLDEILSAIGSWIPLYMTGAIEPYYYPRIRDGVYKRSLYIVPDLCAVTSCSIGNMINPSEDMPTFFFTDKKIIAALQKEFEAYLALCLPLMNIFTPEKNPSYLDLLADFEKKAGHSIIKSKHLSSLSMPEEVVQSLLKRNQQKMNPQKISSQKMGPQTSEKNILAFHNFRIKCLEKTLQESSVREIFSFPSWEALERDEVAIDYSLGLAENEVHYSKDEYRMHLEHVLYLLRKYENYHVSIEKTPYDLGYSIAAKENSSVMISKNGPPLVFLSISGNSLALGFWDFLLKLSQKNELSKTGAIEEIEKMLAAYDG